MVQAYAHFTEPWMMADRLHRHWEQVVTKQVHPVNDTADTHAYRRVAFPRELRGHGYIQPLFEVICGDSEGHRLTRRDLVSEN
jgi:hypothetical protein